jgi:hypothetical protein
MRDAYAAAIGLSATGEFSSKRSFLRRAVLGGRVEPSARATVSPGGTLGLALDEIGIPVPVAHTLFGPGLAAGIEELRTALSGRWAWLKRDPVLHRWGLVPVRVRPVAGDTIRLPASLLGPLGADYDGDTVALFAARPPLPQDPERCRPPVLAWHPALREAMYRPGKQYQYGLRLLAADTPKLHSLQQALRDAGAPEFHADDFNGWVRTAVANEPRGEWWALIEQHALAALADEPHLGFGLLSLDELAKLDAVACKAAKNLYEGEKARQSMAAILAGRSLEIYRRRKPEDGPAEDPIADVMVAAKTSIGYFGGALRRIVYSAEEGRLAPATLQAAQALTEQVTQKALSVKAGKPPLRYSRFNSQLRRLLDRQTPTPSDDPELDELLARKEIQEVWNTLLEGMPRGEAEPLWLRWLRAPHELRSLLDAAPENRMSLPLTDLRLSGWSEPHAV